MSLQHQFVPHGAAEPVTRVTPVAGNGVTDVTSELLRRVTLLEARVALLEGPKPEGKKSRADYMRARRERMKHE